MNTKTREPAATRNIELEVEIDASADVVWRALTEGERLASWFPIDARVTPGAGGSVTLSFGPGMEWTTGIDAWEPGRRLRWVDPLPPDAPPGTVPGAVEWLLEARGGRTKLRLVQSGFSADAAWDEQYECTKGGWTWFLFHLKTWLEAHRGTILRHAAWTRRRFEGTVQDMWARVLTQLAAGRTLSDLAIGDPVAFTVDGGETLQGVVATLNMPHQLGMRLAAYGASLLVVECESTRGGPIGCWLSTFGAGAENERRMQAAIERFAARAVGAD